MLDSYRFGGATFNDTSRATIIEKDGIFLSKIEERFYQGEEKNSMKNSTLCRFFGLSLCQTSFSAPVNVWFEKANTFYSEQKFDSAAHYYEKIIESGYQSSTVYFNCGNAWYRLKKPDLPDFTMKKHHSLIRLMKISGIISVFLIQYR